MGRGSGPGVRPGLPPCENAVTPNTDYKVPSAFRKACARLPSHGIQCRDLALQLDGGSFTALLGCVQVAMGMCRGAAGGNPDPSVALLQNKQHRQGQVASSTVWAPMENQEKGLEGSPGLACCWRRCPLTPEEALPTPWRSILPSS